MREPNIVCGNSNLSALDALPEAQDLVRWMIHDQANMRPSAAAAALHPFFWSDAKKLQFLLDASDRVESEEAGHPLVVQLEDVAARVIPCGNWSQELDEVFLVNLGTHRKYKWSSVRDLLRIVRNKKNHYRDLPPDVQTTLGDLPSGFLRYFTSRFPHLLMGVYEVFRAHGCCSEANFLQYYAPQ